MTNNGDGLVVLPTGSKQGTVSLETSLADLYLRGFLVHKAVFSKAPHLIGERQPRRK